MADTRRLPPPVSAVWDRQLRGACRDLDSTVFLHPTGERGRPRADREERAERVCRACPVMQECRRYALTTAEPYGVWGGLSEDDRRALGGTDHHRTRRRDLPPAAPPGPGAQDPLPRHPRGRAMPPTP